MNVINQLNRMAPTNCLAKRILATPLNVKTNKGNAMKDITKKTQKIETIFCITMKNQNILKKRRRVRMWILTPEKPKFLSWR